MTFTNWRKHAANCREIALTFEDGPGRRVLLEAAEAYSILGLREINHTKLPLAAVRSASH